MKSGFLGQHAIVVGAGISGLVAARVLSDCFERVTVLERDVFAPGDGPRAGVPQGRQYHGLLTGGVDALIRLFDGFEEQLNAVGAVKLISAIDLRQERPRHDPMPQRDLGMRTYSLSRPLLEHCIRQRVRARKNVTLEEGAGVRALCTHGDAVTGAEVIGRGVCEADLVVDASGRGELTVAALERLGMAQPRIERVGVDVRYATATFRMPDNPPCGWKGVMTLPDPSTTSRGGLVVEVEGRTWSCMLGSRGSEVPPTDPEGFVAFARGLRTATIADAIADAEMIMQPESFAFPESQFRHYEELRAFPRGLLPVGDSICRFNPIYGQGMSVAAIELVDLKALIDHGVDLVGLPLAFFPRAAAVIASAWRLSVIPDFAVPTTRGERPPELAQMLLFGALLTELQVRDAQVHRLVQAVTNLVEPATALSDPALVMRVLALHAELQREDPKRWGAA